MRRRLLALLLAALVAGCGVSDQDEVEIVDQPAPEQHTNRQRRLPHAADLHSPAADPGAVRITRNRWTDGRLRELTATTARLPPRRFCARATSTTRFSSPARLARTAWRRR